MKKLPDDRTEKELLDIFGKNIKTRRKDTKWSQEYLAEKAHVSKNTISDIEKGEKFVHAKTLVNLAKALETEPYELLKPDNVVPDKNMDIITKFKNRMNDAVNEAGERFITEMNQENPDQEK